MSIEKKVKAEPQAGSGVVEANVSGEAGLHASRKLTFAENVILTLKVLAGFGLLGALLWGIDLWTAQ